VRKEGDKTGGNLWHKTYFGLAGKKFKKKKKKLPNGNPFKKILFRKELLDFAKRRPSLDGQRNRGIRLQTTMLSWVG